MSKSNVIASETVYGHSDGGYQTAIASAIRHGNCKSNASCEINIIIFDMHFENGEFRVAIQIIVNEIELDLKDHEIDGKRKEDIKFKPSLKKDAQKHDRKDRLHDLIHLLEHTHHHGDTLMAFNNTAIYDHLTTSLENTWELHPNSQAYQDIYKVIKDNLDTPHNDIRLYTQVVDDIAALIPENTGFTRHFVDFAIEQQRHDLMNQNFENTYKPQTPDNNNLDPKPKIVTWWDEK
jgi:hypothetical protein